uniref:Uncharacterized protein n=1 Tax=Marseillevirus LCMAC102 TaxID=2506603 RepID=A0A481YSL2_9VIRU|nr:MAG: hypothetical protein LCMAC102_00020 [Marseillevirus LCMAC102]
MSGTMIMRTNFGDYKIDIDKFNESNKEFNNRPEVKKRNEEILEVPVKITESSYSKYLKKWWETPNSPDNYVYTNLPVSFLISIINPNDFPIMFKLNNYEFPIAPNSEEELNLPIGELVFTCIHVEIIPPISLISRDEAIRHINQYLRNIYDIDYSNWWDEKITDFILTDGAGICSDYSDTLKDISAVNPPIIISSLNIPDTPDIEEWCKTHQNELQQDSNSTNLYNELFGREIDHLIQCPDGKIGCLVAHYKIEYQLDQIAIEFRKKVNANKISYIDLCEWWKSFYESVLFEMIQSFINSNMDNHKVDEFGQMEFPVIDLELPAYIAKGDFRYLPCDKGTWRDYHIGGGTIQKIN